LVEEKSVEAVVEESKKVPASVRPPDIDIDAAMDVIFEANPGPQEDFLASSEQEVLYGGPLANDTLVVTPDGRQRIDELVEGDYVLTPKGSFTTVTGVPFIGVEESYELTFSNGQTVVASAGHKWSVSTGDWSKNFHPFSDYYNKRLT